MRAEVNNNFLSVYRYKVHIIIFMAYTVSMAYFKWGGSAVVTYIKAKVHILISK